MVLASQAHADSTPICLSQIRITFEGALKNITIHHNPAVDGDQDFSSGSTHIEEVSLQSPSPDGNVTLESPALGPSHPLSASANLCLRPGQTTILAFTGTPREAGQVEVSSITTYMKEEAFDLELIFSEDRQLRSDSIWGRNASGIIQRPLQTERSTTVKILPKPPKMQINLRNLLDIYYVDEDIILDFELINGEEESTKGSIDVRLLGPPGIHAKLGWTSSSELSEPLDETASESIIADGHQRLPTKHISVMEPGAQQKLGIRIKSTGNAVEYSLQTEANYSILSDPETPITKTYSTDVTFAQPFEGQFSFVPRLHTGPWPNYFDINDSDESAEEGSDVTGLTQRWALISRLTSLATNDLIIEDVLPVLQRMDPPGTAICSILPTSSTMATSETSSQNKSTMIPGAVKSHPHSIDVQKLDLDDRHAISLDLKLQIRYRRSNPPTSSSEATSTLPTTSTTTLLQVPPLTLNFEPRCLASLGSLSLPSELETEPLIPLIYTIENPSAYTLTFSITMDNNEAFAFSGPKSLSIQLLPLTRRDIEYRLLPIGESGNAAGKGPKGEEGGGRWIWPHCVVVDTGFRKTLRVLPAVEGLKSGKRGEIGVWVQY